MKTNSPNLVDHPEYKKYIAFKKKKLANMRRLLREMDALEKERAKIPWPSELRAAREAKSD